MVGALKVVVENGGYRAWEAKHLSFSSDITGSWQKKQFIFSSDDIHSKFSAATFFVCAQQELSTYQIKG